MESRKLQRVGRSTITVSLPNKWIKENGIRPGDIVFIVPEKDGTLRIVPRERFSQEKFEEEYVINADACTDTGLLERMVVGAYLLGKNVIRITSANRIEKAHMDEIRRIVRKLVGLGILEETENNVLLHCSLDETKFKFDMLIRRLALLVLTVFSEAMRALLKNDKRLAQEAIERENEVDTIYYLAIRLLLSAQEREEVREQTGLTDIRFLPAARLLLQSLELVGDISEDIAKKVISLRDSGETLSEEDIEKIYNIGEKVQEIVKTSVESLFTGDVKLANTILEMKRSLKNEIEKIFYELPKVPYLRAIVSSISNIMHIGSISAEIAINRAIGEQSESLKNIVEVVRHSWKK
ncbi:MAG: phosphate uptake regulator PhoU [Candidatus Bathyarchaeia archaeon]|nr:phosphate uptake regulator PhoU [Candidatus Bathyarchaeota archaeon]